MSSIDRHRLVLDGTARETREPAAFKPGYFGPEERTLADILCLLAGTAERVPFYGPDGRRQDGGWRRVFGADPVFAYAALLAIRTDERRAAFNCLLESDPSGAIDVLAESVDVLLKTRRAAERDAEGEMARVLGTLGDQGARQEFMTWAQTLAGTAPTDRAAAVMAMEGEAAAANPVEAAFAARRSLSQAHDRLLNVISTLQSHAAEALKARVSSGRLGPAVGLAIAKIEALREVGARRNRFTQRHIDFYYRDVLGQTPRPRRLDRTHLALVGGPRPTTAPAGARLVAQTEAGEARVYRLIDDLRVAPIEVAEIRILRHRRDLDMRPQGGMGFVTSTSTVTLPPVAPADAPTRRLLDAAGGTEARAGVRIASPILWLAEGRRRITASINLTRRGAGEHDAPHSRDPADATQAETPAAELDEDELRDRIAQALFSESRLMRLFGLQSGEATAEALLTRVLQARELSPDAPPLMLILHALLLTPPPSDDAARAVYGRAVAAALIEGMDWPRGAFRRDLLAALGRGAGGEEAVHDAARLFDTDPAARFHELLGESFALRLSTGDGWLDLPDARVLPKLPQSPPGLRFRITLDGAAPAIAPPPDRAAPELEIVLSPNARFNAASMLEPYILESVDLAVQAQGLSRVLAFGDTGPLDVAQPFYPFGVQPRAGAALLVGCPELARKSVRRIGVTVEWADLPASGDGLGEIYAAYGDDFEPPDPLLAASYLTQDGWKALGEATVRMFCREPTTRAFASDVRFEARIPGDSNPPGYGFDAAAFKRRQDVRAGLLRLELVGREDPFGHAVYPIALSRAMRPRYIPFFQPGTPRPPYTPRVAGVRLDYAARTRILVAAPSGGAGEERIVQLGPFGEVEIAPAQQRAAAGFCPDRIADGALLVRLAGPNLSGRISLLFRTEDASHRRRVSRPARVSVKYLTALGWADLPPERIVSDSTDRLMRTGLVTLDLPNDAALESSEMPGRGMWLAFCADELLDDFPRLAALQTNAGCAERDLSASAADESDGGPAALKTLALDPPIPGVIAAVQVGMTFGSAAPETDRAFRTRMAERLRHRGRAVTPWDVERLVLEAFPEVWKAKCLPAFSSEPGAGGAAGSEAAGAAVVTVVPHPPSDRLARPEQGRTFDILTLRSIAAMLARVSSPFAKIEVRNPSFERLQIRCAARFDASADGGALAQRLKLDVSRYLSVWTASGRLGGFGWSTNIGDVGGFILSRDYVKSLGEFSILQLVQRDDGAYELLDTAGPGASETLRPSEPWSLALPMPEQWIRTQQAETPLVNASAQRTGIGGLRVGGNLVVTAKGSR